MQRPTVLAIVAGELFDFFSLAYNDFPFLDSLRRLDKERSTVLKGRLTFWGILGLAVFTLVGWFLGIKWPRVFHSISIRLYRSDRREK